MDKRTYSRMDRLLIQIERGLSTVCTDLAVGRPNPAKDLAEPALTRDERRISGEMMRVNHTGEVCAQALYDGQRVMARSPIISQVLEQAVAEETDHLGWTGQRLRELSAHRSYLNFFWYTQSYLLGLLAGLAGDRWSLGFIEETEQQVTRHLNSHLKNLPERDSKSRRIIEQMRQDEQRHARVAAKNGGAPLPGLIKRLMSLQAKIMTLTAAKL